MQVLGEVGSLVYTQTNNGCGFSPRGTQSLVRDQRTRVLRHDLVVRYLDSHTEENDIISPPRNTEWIQVTRHPMSSL